MSDTPSVVTGDFETPTTDPPPEGQATASATADDRRRVHDVWVAGTEEPSWVKQSTDEGAQELLPEADDPGAAAQRGTLVSDDFVVEAGSDEDELQIINMGPQHPSTHGVLRLHLEMEGETIRRVK
ncbi:MAG: hypothetical protein ACE5GC_09115, partial [Acidimicrobiia bacterium]